jgi:hypothetical protein
MLVFGKVRNLIPEADGRECLQRVDTRLRRPVVALEQPFTVCCKL